jgi:hypothetical protein
MQWRHATPEVFVVSLFICDVAVDIGGIKIESTGQGDHKNKCIAVAILPLPLSGSEIK